MLFPREYTLPEISSAKSSVPSQATYMEWKNLISESLFLQTLKQNTPLYIEPNHGNGAAPLPFPGSGEPALLLSLTTLTCYRTPVALFLCNAIASHYGIPAHTIMDIRTATHEAIANAVIHGNLGMQEHFYGIQEFTTYHNRILSLLEKPEYALRRVILSIFYASKEITIRISDEGDGYSVPLHRSSLDELPLGKGLSLIHKHSKCVTLLEGGRTIEMDFAL